MNCLWTGAAAVHPTPTPPEPSALSTTRRPDVDAVLAAATEAGRRYLVFDVTSSAARYEDRRVRAALDGRRTTERDSLVAAAPPRSYGTAAGAGD
mmetsp:Transcript_8598/g.26876  ORF Transcript_8598/g.26876 Transcript_8598/m.26876 type:complete len:95 (-) Transcript_8598:223-507(-)